MKERLTVCRDGDPIYDICMETSFEGLKGELAAFHLEKRKICIVTDSNVAFLYLDKVKEILSQCCSMVSVFIFPAGEEHKNLDTVRML